MTPIAILDLKPYQGYLQQLYTTHYLRLISPFDHYINTLVESFISEMNRPLSSTVITEAHLDLSPVILTDEQYHLANQGLVAGVNLLDVLLHPYISSVDVQQYHLTYHYTPGVMLIIIYQQGGL